MLQQQSLETRTPGQSPPPAIQPFLAFPNGKGAPWTHPDHCWPMKSGMLFDSCCSSIRALFFSLIQNAALHLVPAGGRSWPASWSPARVLHNPPLRGLPETEDRVPEATHHSPCNTQGERTSLATCPGPPSCMPAGVRITKRFAWARRRASLNRYQNGRQSRPSHDSLRCGSAVGKT